MSGKFDIDEEAIRRLAALLEESGLTEIEVGAGDHHLRVARVPQPIAQVAPIPAVATAPAAAAPPPVSGSEAESDANHPGAVTSPMVGTAYVAPEPGADPFIAVGDTVTAGDTLFLIEAMKTLNPVRAPHDGKVTRVLIENAVPVEYGEVLAVVE